jgi:hypothetical protein
MIKSFLFFNYPVLFLFLNILVIFDFTLVIKSCPLFLSFYVFTQTMMTYLFFSLSLFFMYYCYYWWWWRSLDYFYFVFFSFLLLWKCIRKCAIVFRWYVLWLLNAFVYKNIWKKSSNEKNIDLFFKFLFLINWKKKTNLIYKIKTNYSYILDGWLGKEDDCSLSIRSAVSIEVFS